MRSMTIVPFRFRDNLIIITDIHTGHLVQLLKAVMANIATIFRYILPINIGSPPKSEQMLQME